MTKFKSGDKVWYAGDFGTAKPVPAVIAGVDEKNGKTVYDVQLSASDCRWGYESQFTPRKMLEVVQ